MKIERVIDVPVDASTARSRVLSFYSLSGYKKLGGDDTLEFKRGSTLGTAFSFNPANWKCSVAVKITSTIPARVAVAYDVRNDPFENSITRELWNEELDRLQACLETGAATAPDQKENTRRVARFVFKTIGLPGGIFLVLVIAAAIAVLLLTK